MNPKLCIDLLCYLLGYFDFQTTVKRKTYLCYDWELVIFILDVDVELIFATIAEEKLIDIGVDVRESLRATIYSSDFYWLLCFSHSPLLSTYLQQR